MVGPGLRLSGGVERVFGAAGGVAGVQNAGTVVVVAGAVDREAPDVGGTAVAQPAQQELLTVGKGPGHVGEAGPWVTSMLASACQRSRARADSLDCSG
jgi:hypothetical protein